jgi:Flp pilus assembly protein TadD
LSKLENYKAAAKAFEFAKASYPDPYQIGFNLVLTNEKARDFERAIQMGEELISKDYRTSELLNLLATAYEQTGQTQKAYDVLRMATELDPSDESNYLDLIALAIQHRNMDLALSICDIGSNNVSGSYRLALAKGAALALAGRPSDAEAIFLKATQSAPKENTPYAALAMVQIQSGKLTEAIHLLRSRKAISPKSYLINLYLGEAFSRKGVAPNTTEDTEADQALREAERANPEAPAPHALRGKLLFSRGDLTNAAHEFEQALQLNPHDSSPAYQLSLIYRKQGDDSRADDMLNLFQKNKQADKDEALHSNLLDVLRDSAR